MNIQKEGFHRFGLKGAVIGSILLLSLFSAPALADILIISNKNVSETSLSEKYVRDIFLGKRVQWQDHSTIHVFVMKDPKICELFLKQYIHKSKSQWKAYWKQMVFTGRGLPPKSANTKAELINFIARTKGAIGFVYTDGLPDSTEKSSVKILKTGR